MELYIYIIILMESLEDHLFQAVHNGDLNSVSCLLKQGKITFFLFNIFLIIKIYSLKLINFE